MMKHFITILILCVGIVINADAQTFTQRIQKTVQGQGTVTIHQDKTIEELVNGYNSAVHLLLFKMVYERVLRKRASG